MADRRVKVCEIVDGMNISYGSLVLNLNDQLDFKRVVWQERKRVTIQTIV